MNNIIAKTHSLTGLLTSSLAFDFILIPIRPITGTYAGLTGSIIRDNYPVFDTLLQQAIKKQPPRHGDCIHITQPHRFDRTFDTIVCVTDNGISSLSSLIEHALEEIFKISKLSAMQTCPVVGIPLFRFDIQEQAEELLLGIRSFQDAHDAPLYIYIAINKNTTAACGPIMNQTSYCGEWRDGRLKT